MEEQGKKEEKVTQVDGKTEPVVAEEGKDTREQRRKIRRNSRKVEKIRLIPIWLRLIIVFFLVCVSLAGGLMVGYGVLGGETPLEALKPSTWTHIIDIINGTES